MVVVTSGQPAPTPGFYVDGHGHRMLLRPGELAPICTFSGATPVLWRLLAAVPMPGPTS